MVSDFVASEISEEPDYFFISPNSLEIYLPSGHELTLNHVSLNSYSILVRMQSKELNTWKMAYPLDAIFSKVLKASITDNDKEGNHPQYQIHDRLIYFKDWNGNFRLCKPDSLQITVMAEIHNSQMESAHGGHAKTYNKFVTTYYWPKMSRDIKWYVSTCDICQKAKPRCHAPTGLLQPIPISSQPFKVVWILFQSYLCLIDSTISWLLLIN